MKILVIQEMRQKSGFLMMRFAMVSLVSLLISALLPDTAHSAGRSSSSFFNTTEVKSKDLKAFKKMDNGSGSLFKRSQST